AFTTDAIRSRCNRTGGDFVVAGQDDEGDSSAGKILLVADSSVGRQQQVDRRFLRGIQQGTVVERVPSSGLGCDDRVARKRTGQALWYSVVKEDEHRPAQEVAPALKP